MSGNANNEFLDFSIKPCVEHNGNDDVLLGSALDHSKVERDRLIMLLIDGHHKELILRGRTSKDRGPKK